MTLDTVFLTTGFCPAVKNNVGTYVLGENQDLPKTVSKEL